MPLTPRYILSIVLLFSCSVNVQAKEAGLLSFVGNNGQWTKQVLYKSDVRDGTVYFLKDRFRYNFYNPSDIAKIHGLPKDAQHNISAHAYDVIFKGSSAELVEGGDTLKYYHNYFIGNDRSKWATGVPVFQQVSYNALYPAIDMQVYSSGVSLKYDLLVYPGGDARDIQMQFDGVSPAVDESGNLVIHTTVNTVVELAPYAYQLIDGIETAVPCRYVIKNNKLGFDFPVGYDKTQLLIIDPVLKFATYTGSTGQLWGYCTAFDAQGNFYSGTEAYGTGFPTTVGAYQVSYNYRDIAINKYDSTGSKLIFSTYCGGSFSEYPTNMIVNKYNELIITGRTYSADYPVSSSAVSRSHNGGSDIFVTVFNHSGSSIIGSTYMGGADDDGHSSFAFQLQDSDKSGLSVDDNGNIYIATSTKSKDFPVTTGAYQTTPGSSYDGCIFKLNRNCSSLLFSTYLGGNHQDCIYDCKLMPNGNIVVCGMSVSSNFPLTTNAYSDSGKAFVSILSNNGSFMVSSTKLGLHSASALKISLDDNDNIFVCGNNDTGLVVSPGTFHQPNGKIFIAKMSPGLDSMILSAKLVDVPAPGVTGFVNVCGDLVASIYINKTNSNLPVSQNSYQSTPGTYYFFHLSPAMDTLLYATYFGVNDGNCHSHGNANIIDTNGVIWASLCISMVKDSLLGTTGSYCPKSLSTASYSDFLSAKFDMEILPAKPLAKAYMPDTVCAKADVYFYNQSKNAYSYIWHFGDGDTSHAKNPVHSYDTPGFYRVKLEAYNSYSCRSVDSLLATVYVDTNRIRSAFVSVDTSCIGNTVQFNNTSTSGVSTFWDFGDGTTANTYNGQHVYNAAGKYFVKLVTYNPDFCNKTDTAIRLLVIDTTSPGAAFSIDKSIACADKPVQFTNNTPRAAGYTWSFGDGTTAYDQHPSHIYIHGGKQTVRLIATNNKLCVPKDTAYGTVDVLPPLQIDLADSFICGGHEPVEWGIRLIHVNSNPTYKWEPANAILSAANEPVATVDPQVSTKYYVTVTDTIPGMCAHERRDTANLIIVDYPEDVYANSNSPVCEGDELILQGGTSTTIPMITYSWEGPDYFSASGKFAGRTPLSRKHAGKYRIGVSNQGCVTYAETNVIVKPKPQIETGSNSPVWTGRELKLIMTSDILLDSFYWTGPAGFHSIEPNPVINPVTLEAEGSYAVRGWYDGCLSGDITIVTVSETDSQYLRLYPNPNNGTFYIEGKGYHEQAIKMLVVNSVGQKLYRVDVNTDKKRFRHQVVLPAVSGGVYFIWVLMEGEYRALPFTILRQ